MSAVDTKPPLEIVPLGGLGEFGLNMMAISSGDTMVVVDVGIMFPDAELLGVDLVIPDMTYLRQNQDRFKAVILTHGHEDHIGALPYLLKEFEVPVYGTRLTLGLVRHRLEEHHLSEKTALRTVTPGEVKEIGPLKVDFIRVTHSLADAVSLAIETPQGTVIHTGDFKLDQNPIVGESFDLHRLAHYGMNERSGSPLGQHQQRAKRANGLGKRCRGRLRGRHLPHRWSRFCRLFHVEHAPSSARLGFSSKIRKKSRAPRSKHVRKYSDRDRSGVSESGR